ncbi:MAG: hypothetical protein K6T81_04650 [Alicyclobacillus macrosporangiidus]|uniref:hypothetical protein n=1 Tax=Alicyclobacillus macrosporangiidus TaxID=392015 RepID=UPI0026EE2932|nr:hypothetical protein [Alicyclobacillus macrosporangiidus]MCL6598010.1 hypothetical protein [Alicyclobacillus macrosporangiidus]
MLHYGLVLEQSRKAKSVRHLYEHLQHKVHRREWIPSIQIDSLFGENGIRVPPQERYRVLNLRLLDEHLSPYFKTNLNLFQMHMMDDKVEVTVYRAPKGWLFVFEDVPSGPKPFGQNGYDTR